MYLRKCRRNHSFSRSEPSLFINFFNPGSAKSCPSAFATSFATMTSWSMIDVTWSSLTPLQGGYFVRFLRISVQKKAYERMPNVSVRTPLYYRTDLRSQKRQRGKITHMVDQCICSHIVITRQLCQCQLAFARVSRTARHCTERPGSTRINTICQNQEKKE